MNVNTSLVTDTGRNITEVSVDAYRDKIAEHIGNDLIAHTAINLYEGTPYYELAPASTHLVSSATLRMLLTDGAGVTQAWALPALVQAGTFPPSGSAPIILRQPASTTTKVGDTTTFSVYVASATPGFYQWQKNAVNIANANNPEYVILDTQLSDVGNYRCLITNIVGTTTSTDAALAVTTS